MSVREVGAGRGLALTALLGVLAVIQLWSGFVSFRIWRTVVEHALPGQGWALLGVLQCILLIVTLAGIWLRRKRAVYAFAALAVVGIAVDVSLDLPSWALLIRLVLFGALAWSIRQKWATFS